MKEKCVTPLIYENERESHKKSTVANMQTLKEVRTVLFDNDPTAANPSIMSSTLRTPKEARKEVETLRDQLS